MIRKFIIRIGFNWIFFISIILLYLITFIISRNVFIEMLIYAKSIFIEVFPVLVAVFVLTFFANIWLSNNKAKKVLSSKSGFWKYFSAVLFGILSSGPIYMWYPLLSELQEGGLDNSFIAIFLYNRSVKIPLMPMIIYYFGLPFLIITTGFMVLFSLINGYLVSKFTSN